MAEQQPAGRTAILGAGVMGETLLSGLVRAGRRVDALLVGEKRAERAHELEERYGVSVVGNREAARRAEDRGARERHRDDIPHRLLRDARRGRGRATRKDWGCGAREAFAPLGAGFARA